MRSSKMALSPAMNSGSKGWAGAAGLLMGILGERAAKRPGVAHSISECYYISSYKRLMGKR
ncbi:MAG TPA: hypothetical protein DCW87_09895 [Comamonadaceae bacterium]|nr:hypothetical protein [Comamonadaceae bacterium]